MNNHNNEDAHDIGNAILLALALYAIVSTLKFM